MVAFNLTLLIPAISFLGVVCWCMSIFLTPPTSHLAVLLIPLMMPGLMQWVPLRLKVGLCFLS